MVLTLLVGCEVPELDIPETEIDQKIRLKKEREQQEKEDAGVTDEDLKVPVFDEEKDEERKTKEFTAKDSKKGKKSREAGGYLGAIGSARFTAQNKLIMAQIKSMMGAYRANNDGNYPKTQEEFMEKIIKAGQIELPELEADEEYVYDPEDPLVLKFRKKQ